MATLGPADAFCSVCGTPAPGTAPAAPPKPGPKQAEFVPEPDLAGAGQNYCETCGAPLTPGAAACTSCGKLLVQVAKPVSTQAATIFFGLVAVVAVVLVVGVCILLAPCFTGGYH